MYNGMTPSQVAAAAEKIGFDVIGTYNPFTHCDVRGTKVRWDTVGIKIKVQTKMLVIAKKQQFIKTAITL